MEVFKVIRTERPHRPVACMQRWLKKVICHRLHLHLHLQSTKSIVICVAWMLQSVKDLIIKLTLTTLVAMTHLFIIQASRESHWKAIKKPQLLLTQGPSKQFLQQTQTNSTHRRARSKPSWAGRCALKLVSTLNRSWALGFFLSNQFLLFHRPFLF